METMTRCGDEWIVRLLASKGVLGPKDAGDILLDDSPFASTALLRRKAVSKERLAEAVREQYGISFAEPVAGSSDKIALSLVPEEICRRHMLFPLRVDAETIELLMANPLDSVVMDSVMALSGRRPIPFFGLPEKIEELITAGYGADAAIFDLLHKLPDEAPVICLDSGAEQPAEPASSIGAPVIRLANQLISQAVRMNASDIHIEHEERVTIVRYRVDGDLRGIMKVPKHLGEGPLVSRIKIMANLDVADRRRPQDGRAKLKVGSEEIGLRVSTMPTSFGEKVVLRILDNRQAEVPLEALGFRPEIMSRLVRISQSNQGILLVTGPTGSGKTTTLYSLLNRLKSEDINIVTVEDPIEYRLNGINQIQVNEKVAMTFAAVLRSVLRQDPDTVLIGEIRDHETADIAFQAALTGHLVFSTLHTNDAVASVERLLDMGVERFKMGPALIGVCSQRLVRRICPDCREEIAVDAACAELFAQAGLPRRRFKGKGCENCAFTGLKGRIALCDLLDLSSPVARDILSASAGDFNLREEALKRDWLKPMAEDALWHLSQGHVTFDEAAPYLQAKAAGGEAPARPARASAPPQVPQARRVLIVDDNPDNRTLVRQTLGSEGFELAEADGGAKALESIARNRPDLVLLDLMMPEVGGFSVVRRLRGEMGMADLPILVITAMGEADSQALALELGADDYLTKPFSPQVLRARVKALFRRCEFEEGRRDLNAL